MIGWLNDHLHPEPLTDKCGNVCVAPVGTGTIRKQPVYSIRM